MGTVNGIHGALCAAMEMGSFLVGLVLKRPEQFGLLLAMSLCSVRRRYNLRCNRRMIGHPHTVLAHFWSDGGAHL